MWEVNKINTPALEKGPHITANVCDGSASSSCCTVGSWSDCGVPVSSSFFLSIWALNRASFCPVGFAWLGLTTASFSLCESSHVCWWVTWIDILLDWSCSAFGVCNWIQFLGLSSGTNLDSFVIFTSLHWGKGTVYFEGLQALAQCYSL